MTAPIQTAPDEETPLLTGNNVSAIEPGSEAATVADPSTQSSRTPSVKRNANPDGVSKPTKRTPLPWAQLSIILFLQLAEPLTSQVIYPVSSALGITYPALNAPVFPVCT
jgi:hypothetical protein